MEGRNWNRPQSSASESSMSSSLLAWFESRPIHPVNRTTIRNQARRLTRSYSQSGAAHAPKLKPGFGARLMNNFGVTIRTRTRTSTIRLTNFGIQDKIAQNRKRRARCGPGSLELVPGGAADELEISHRPYKIAQACPNSRARCNDASQP